MMDDGYDMLADEKPVPVKAWLEAARTRIPGLDAEIIAQNCFAPEGSDRSWLVAHDGFCPGWSRRSQADEMVRQREEGIPLAYIMGKKEFYGRDFVVTRDVLIPRPETEALIDIIKGLDLPRQPRFLDVGTGSGCIAITLALEFPQAKVYASDLSTEALTVANENDVQLEGRVEFMHSDMLDEISLLTLGPFDVLVANLPYVDPRWDFIDTEALAREPVMALYAMGEKGLAMYRRLFNGIYEGDYVGNVHPELTSVRRVVVEADPCQHKDLMKMAQEYGWKVFAKQGYGIGFYRA